MKQSALRILAPFCFLNAAVGFAGNLLANEVALAEHAVTVQLHKDGAPEKLVKEESDLLSRAEKAIKGKVASSPGRGASFLADRAQSGAQATQALAAKVTREVDFAAKAVVVQLEQDHAPASLVEEEKGLLTKAEAAAQNAQQMLGKIVKGRKHSMQQHSAAKQSNAVAVGSGSVAKENLKTETRMLDSVAVQETKILANERGQMRDLRTIEGEAKKALQAMHASSDTKQNINKLLSELKEDNRKLVKVEEKDLRNTFSLRNLRHISHSTEVLQSSEDQQAKKGNNLQNPSHISHSTEELERIVSSENQKIDKGDDFRNLRQVTPSTEENQAMAKPQTSMPAQGLRKIKSLEEESNKLHAENARLKKEHAILEENLEKHLANENMALATQNHELENENEELKRQLNPDGW